MKDAECVTFLQWCLPRLGMRWPGFRRVRRQVCKRVGRRLAALGLADAAAYRVHLDRDPAEWRVLDGLCRITISRFYRDKGLFDQLGAAVLPALADLAARRGDEQVGIWSAGCASGEEAYTVAVLWHLRVRPLVSAPRMHLTATDAEPAVLARARRGCYPAGALRELPEDLRDAAFDRTDAGFCVRAAFREGVRFLEQDIREEAPAGPFHLVLCRNLAFTYFDDSAQRRVLDRLVRRLRPGGYLVLGRHERLPACLPDLAPAADRRDMYLKRETPERRRRAARR